MSPRKKKEAVEETETSVEASDKKSSVPSKVEVVDRSAEIDKWVAKTQNDKRYKGTGQICMANQLDTPYRTRRPTGITGLDIALGGGFAAGGFSQVTGPEGVGKTMITYMTAGQVQKNYGAASAIYLGCSEMRPDVGFARQCGFHIAYSESEIQTCQRIRASKGLPDFTEEELEDLRGQTGKVVVGVAERGDLLLDQVITAIETDYFPLCILDSLGSLLTEDEEEKQIGESSFGGSSRILTRFQNKLYPTQLLSRLDGSIGKTTLLGINQVRANTDGGLYGPKTKPAAGSHAVKHGLLVSVELAVGSAIKGEDKEVLGKEIRWKLTKGKAGTHDGKTGTYNFYHLKGTDPVFWKDVQNQSEVTGVDIYADLLEVAKGFGFVKAQGAWFKWFNNDGTQLLQTQGIDAMAGEIFADPQKAGLLREQCYQAANLMVEYV